MRFVSSVSYNTLETELLESHVGTMPVRAVVRAADDARKTPFADAVRQFGFQRVVGTVPCVQVGANPILVHFAGHNIYYATHGIRTVEYGCRATQYLHPVGQERLVGIGNRMSEDAGILWMPINKHHQAGIAAT